MTKIIKKKYLKCPADPHTVILTESWADCRAAQCTGVCSSPCWLFSALQGERAGNGLGHCFWSPPSLGGSLWRLQMLWPRLLGPVWRLKLLPNVLCSCILCLLVPKQKYVSLIQHLESSLVVDRFWCGLCLWADMVSNEELLVFLNHLQKVQFHSSPFKKNAILHLGQKNPGSTTYVLSSS